MSEGFLYVCTLLLPFERKLISIFEELVSSEMPPHVKGGNVGAALALRVKRELMELRSLYYIARGLDVFAQCLPFEQNEVMRRIVEAE